MPTTQLIAADRLDELLAAVFADGEPIVSEAWSDFDAAAKIFPTLDCLRGDIQSRPGQKRTCFQYAIHYPEAGGFVVEKRVELEPGTAEGHTHRFTMEGWGLIYLRLKDKGLEGIECGVTAPSRERAGEEADACEHLGTPDLWDWELVERQAGRLRGFIEKLAGEGPA